MKPLKYLAVLQLLFSRRASVLGLRVKKIKRYVERCEVKREVFHNLVKSLPQDRLYYIDECGIDTYIYREYAYAPRGKAVAGAIAILLTVVRPRLHAMPYRAARPDYEKENCYISGKKFKRTNIVAARCIDNIVAPMIYDGTTDTNPRLKRGVPSGPQQQGCWETGRDGSLRF